MKHQLARLNPVEPLIGSNAKHRAGLQFSPNAGQDSRSNASRLFLYGDAMGRKKVPVLPGDKYARLTVIEEVAGIQLDNGQVRRQAMCRCECGKEIVTRLDCLRGKSTRSCGCLNREKNVTHGKARSDVRDQAWSTWRAMRSRCLNPSASNYGLYGGLGIRICDRWEDFSLFLEDMGDRPKGTTIDRIDSQGNYEPDNCRWATPKQQARNRSSNKMITYEGETRCISEWAEHLGISSSTLNNRLVRFGWSIERSLTAPVQVHRVGR